MPYEEDEFGDNKAGKDESKPQGKAGRLEANEGSKMGLRIWV